MRSLAALISLSLVLAPAVAAPETTVQTALLRPSVRFASFPRINQLAERADDGTPSANAQMNCIPASIAAGLNFLLGTRFTGASIEEAVYGRTFRGPTQIYRYLPWVRRQGVEMRPILSHNSETLVAELRKLMERGVPAIISVPGDPEHPPIDPLHPSSVTHVVIAAGFDASGNIRVMNPWGGVWLSGNDAYWASRICYGEVWAFEPTNGAVDPLAQPERQVQPVSVEPRHGRTLRPLGRTRPL